MTAGGKKPSPPSGFLFVNKDAKNIHTRGHIGAVNAHVHADARAKKRKQQKSQPPQSPEQQQSSEVSGPLQTRIHSWRIGKFENHINVDEIGNDVHPTAKKSSPGSSPASPSSPISIVSLCNSPSTLPESGPCTPEELPTSLTVQSAPKRAQVRLLGRHHRRRQQVQGPPPTFKEDVAQASEARPIETSIGAYIGSDGLDPFFQFPSTTTQSERALTQYYLSSIGTLVYGTRKDALFCPVRDVTFANVSAHPMVLQWVIIGSEAHLAARRGLPEPASLLRRKADVYRQMNEALSHPVERFAEGTFTAISGAIVVDSRAAGPKVASLHLRGMEMLVQTRGGLESIYRENPSTYAVFFFLWAYHACGGGDIADRIQLNTYNSEFLQTLCDIQDWNRNFRHHLRRLSVHRLWHGGALASSVSAKSKRGTALRNPDTMLEAFATAWTRTFSRQSVLHPLIDPDFPCSNAVETTCHFSNLYTINLTLWTFRTDLGAGTAFLNRLMKHMNENGYRDPITGLTSLTLTALVWFLRKARVEVDNDGEQSQQREVWMSWKIIHALKVMALMSANTRRNLVRKMSAWLTEVELPMDMEVGKSELEAIGEEVGRSWETNAE